VADDSTNIIHPLIRNNHIGHGRTCLATQRSAEAGIIKNRSVVISEHTEVGSICTRAGNRSMISFADERLCSLLKMTTSGERRYTVDP
jgi:hypothetical protein